MIHKVEYSMVLPDGTKGTITRNMDQNAISELLSRPDVVLIGVNREVPVFYPRRKKSKGGGKK